MENKFKYSKFLDKESLDYINDLYSTGIDIKHILNLLSDNAYHAGKASVVSTKVGEPYPANWTYK